MKKLTEKQYYYIQDALLSKFYEQEKLLWEKMSKILVNINKQISLLNNNEINSVIQMIKNRRTELSMKGKNKKQGWEDNIYYGQKNYRDV